MNIQHYSLCQKALEQKKHIEESFIHLAQTLYLIKENNYWETGGYTTWYEFLEELRISNSTAMKLIAIYKTFVLEYGYSPSEVVTSGGWSVLAEALPIIDSKEKAGEVLSDASVLSLRDMRDSVKRAKMPLTEQFECQHKDSYIIRICPDCGDKTRIYEIHQ